MRHSLVAVWLPLNDRPDLNSDAAIALLRHKTPGHLEQ
jgi:hypothetical protein